jgi:glutaminase
MVRVDRGSKVKEEEEIVSRISKILMLAIVCIKIQDKEIAEEDNREVTNSTFNSNNKYSSNKTHFKSP